MKGKTDEIGEINRRHRIINETVDLGLWNRFRSFQVFLGLFSKKQSFEVMFLVIMVGKKVNKYKSVIN